MKLVSRILTMALILAMVLSVSAFAEINATYTTDSTMFVEAVGWNFNDSVTLVLTGDDTYELWFKENIFGTTDPGMKGSKTVIYSGTYTSAPAADGAASHLDITLNTVDNVYFEQHGKAYGRQVLNYSMVLNSAAWTDEMNDMALVYEDDAAAAFVAAHSFCAGWTITVEDLLLDLDDTTLETKIVEIPDYSVLNFGE